MQPFSQNEFRFGLVQVSPTLTNTRLLFIEVSFHRPFCPLQQQKSEVSHRAIELEAPWNNDREAAQKKVRVYPSLSAVTILMINMYSYNFLIFLSMCDELMLN